MSDGLQVPGKHDGMAAFDSEDGRIRLICNQEIQPEDTGFNTLRERFPALPEHFKAKFYDRGGDRTPGLGGDDNDHLQPRHGQNREAVPEPGWHRIELRGRPNTLG